MCRIYSALDLYDDRREIAGRVDDLMPGGWNIVERLEIFQLRKINLHGCIRDLAVVFCALGKTLNHLVLVRAAFEEQWLDASLFRQVDHQLTLTLLAEGGIENDASS